MGLLACLSPGKMETYFQDENIDYYCSSGMNVTVEWRVNGSSIHDLPVSLRDNLHSSNTTVFNTVLHTLTITLAPEFNGTKIECVVESQGLVIEKAIIILQGPLSEVTDVSISSISASINVSWSAPFSLDVTGVDPDIWYSVLIYNVTDNPTAIPCTDCMDITETHYTFTPDYLSPCHKYIFTVIPLNGAGQGEAKNVTGSYANKTSQMCNSDHFDVVIEGWSVFLSTDCVPNSNFMLGMEFDSKTVLVFLQNLTELCTRLRLDGKVLRVLLYSASETGYPLRGTIPARKWFFKNENSGSSKILEPNGSVLSGGCNDCTVLCLDQNATIAVSGPQSNLESLDPGYYQCAYVREWQENATLHSVEVTGKGDVAETNSTETNSTQTSTLSPGVLTLSILLPCLLVLVTCVCLLLLLLLYVYKYNKKKHLPLGEGCQAMYPDGQYTDARIVFCPDQRIQMHPVEGSEPDSDNSDIDADTSGQVLIPGQYCLTKVNQTELESDVQQKRESQRSEVDGGSQLQGSEAKREGSEVNGGSQGGEMNGGSQGGEVDGESQGGEVDGESQGGEMNESQGSETGVNYQITEFSGTHKEYEIAELGRNIEVEENKSSDETRLDNGTVQTAEERKKAEIIQNDDATHTMIPGPSAQAVNHKNVEAFCDQKLTHIMVDEHQEQIHGAYVSHSGECMPLKTLSRNNSFINSQVITTDSESEKSSECVGQSNNKSDILVAQRSQSKRKTLRSEEMSFQVDKEDKTNSVLCGFSQLSTCTSSGVEPLGELEEEATDHPSFEVGVMTSESSLNM